MANFDQFERYYKTAIGQESDDLRKLAEDISNLPEPNKVLVVKGKSKEEILIFLQKGRIALRNYFPHGAKFVSSSNNQSGSDLLEVASQIPIELKSGSHKTDGNSGLEIVSWALGDKDKTDLSEIMVKSMTERRNLYLANQHNAVQASKRNTMESLFQYISARISQGDLTPPRLKHFVICVAQGLTKSSEIKTSFDGAEVRAPLLLEADWETGLKRYENSFLPDEEIEIKSIELTETRVQVVCRGKDSKINVRLYPNYKNSYKKGATKIPAENWVSNACFHVWVGQDVSQER